MNRTQTVLVVVALCGVMVAWQLQERPAESITSADVRPQSPATETSADPAAAPQQPTEPLTDTSRSTAPATETEQVLGLTVRRDRDCSIGIRHVVDAETSELHEVYACTPDNPPAPDPYESWDEETLAGLAYGDAHAAEVLGLRHVGSEDARQEELGLYLLYRSVALSGNPETFQKAIGRRYAYLEINGEPQLDNLKQLLVFNVIGEVLGDERFDPNRIVRELERYDVPEGDIEAVLSGARNILESMALLQTEMTGESVIREALEDA